jgi:hypothetical protein
MELDCCRVRFPKACGWVAVWLHVFLNSAIDRGNWSTSRPSRFSPWGIAPTPAPVKQEVVWAPGPVCKLRTEEHRNATSGSVRDRECLYSSADDTNTAKSIT